MKGSVRKKRKNAWSYRIDLGTVDGKRKQVEKGGFKTEREATKAMQDVLYHLNNTGDYVENKKDLSQRERMVDFVSQIKNPYCYLDRGMVVKISFAGENRLEDTLKKCARTHMR